MITTVTTAKGEFLFVGVPEHAMGIQLTSHKDGILYRINNKWEQVDLEPKSTYRIIDLYPGITVEQACEIVPVNTCEHGYAADFYYDYLDKENVFDTAIESVYSLMQANGVYTVNPYSEPVFSDYIEMNGEWISEAAEKQYLQLSSQYQSYKSKVFKQQAILKKEK